MTEQIYTTTQIQSILSPVFRNHNVKKAILFGSYGEVIRMDEFFEELERNNTIEIARKMYQDEKNTATAVSVIKFGLDVSTEEAQEIFDTEIMGVALA